MLITSREEAAEFSRERKLHGFLASLAVKSRQERRHRVNHVRASPFLGFIIRSLFREIAPTAKLHRRFAAKKFAT